MDHYSLYAPLTLGSREFCIPEKNEACPGCGAALALRYVYKTLGLPHELSATWKLPGKKKESLSRPALLSIKKGPGGDSKPVEILVDNEADLDASHPNFFHKKEPEKAVGKGYAYVATACSSYPFDLIDKLTRAQKVKGRVFMHVLTPCPVGWGFDEDMTVKVGCWAVESRIFPLYEVEKRKATMTIDIPNARPARHYLAPQKRFEGLTDQDVEEITKSAADHYERLVKKGF
jgi:pyruvate/2-oxoacid:ferredoxin oxidoreductase beta subunit